VRLAVGSFADLASLGETFDKVFAVNSAAFWPRPVAALELLAAHLGPGGTIAITEQPRMRGATETAASQAAERLKRQLRGAGYLRLRLETLPLDPVPAVCVLASSGDSAAPRAVARHSRREHTDPLCPTNGFSRHSLPR
jgi:hypothetical protein